MANRIFIPTFISSVDYQPARVLPHIYFFNGLKDCEPYYIQHYTDDTKAEVTSSLQTSFPYFDYYDGLVPSGNSNSLLFFNETPAYGETPSGSLYTDYWNTYVSLLYNPKTRLIDTSAIIPLADYFAMELNDIVEWRGNYYHLRAINDYNLVDGTCKLQLLGPIIRDTALPQPTTTTSTTTLSPTTSTTLAPTTTTLSPTTTTLSPTTTTTFGPGTTTTLSPTTTTLSPTTTTLSPTTTTLSPTTTTQGARYWETIYCDGSGAGPVVRDLFGLLESGAVVKFSGGGDEFCVTLTTEVFAPFLWFDITQQGYTDCNECLGITPTTTIAPTTQGPTTTIAPTTTTLSPTTTQVGTCRNIWVNDSVDGSRYGLRYLLPNVGQTDTLFDDLLGTPYTLGGNSGTVYSVCSTIAPLTWDSVTNTTVDLGSQVVAFSNGGSCQINTSCEFVVPTTTTVGPTTTIAPTTTTLSPTTTTQGPTTTTTTLAPRYWESTYCDGSSGTPVLRDVSGNFESGDVVKFSGGGEEFCATLTTEVFSPFLWFNIVEGAFFDCAVCLGLTTTTTLSPTTTVAPTTTTLSPTTTTLSPTTLAPTTTTTTLPLGCFTYSIQNNDLSQTLTFGYTDCDGNPVTDQVVLADSSTPDFCAEEGSVYRQSGTNSWVLTTEATTCTVVEPTTTTVSPTTTTVSPTTTTISPTTLAPTTTIAPTTTTVAPCNCITVDVLNTQLTDGGLDLYYIVNDCGGGSRDINLATSIGTEQDGSTYFGICSRGTTSNLFKYGPSGSPFVGLPGMNINPNGTICTVDGDCLPVTPPTTTTTLSPTTLAPTTTTTEAPLTEFFIRTSGFGIAENACGQATVASRWHNGTGALPEVGDRVYLTNSTSNPMLGDDIYYAINTTSAGTNTEYALILSTGFVDERGTCPSPTTTTLSPTTTVSPTTTTVSPTTLAPTTTTLAPGTLWNLFCPSSAGGGCAYSFTKLNGDLCSDTIPPDTDTIFCVKEGSTPSVTGGVWTELGDPCSFNSCLENP